MCAAFINWKKYNKCLILLLSFLIIYKNIFLLSLSFFIKCKNHLSKHIIDITVIYQKQRFMSWSVQYLNIKHQQVYKDQ